MGVEKHDIVIPLGIKSFENKNFEVKIAVSSIKKHVKFLKRIIIVTQTKPIKELGDDIIWIYQDDIYNHDKDANIIEKTRKAIEKIPDLTDDFILWSDDQFVTKDTYWEDTQPRYLKIYSPDTKEWFEKQAEKRLWWKRLLMCFKRFPHLGMGCGFFNPHIPSRINKHRFLDMCKTYPYQTENGITIFQLYYNFIGERGIPNFDEFHCHNGETDWKGKRWIGYFDKSLKNPKFKKKLENMFLNKKG